MRVDVSRLLDPAAYPHPTRDIHLIETHISWVILTGDYVYKLKKPCHLGFSISRRSTSATPAAWRKSA